jgi:hypothetical protein
MVKRRGPAGAFKQEIVWSAEILRLRAGFCADDSKKTAAATGSIRLLLVFRLCAALSVQGCLRAIIATMNWLRMPATPVRNKGRLAFGPQPSIPDFLDSEQESVNV